MYIHNMDIEFRLDFADIRLFNKPYGINSTVHPPVTYRVPGCGSRRFLWALADAVIYWFIFVEDVFHSTMGGYVK